MAESRDYLELTFRSINCFTDDGKIDAQELKSLYAIAEKDGIIDLNEKRVLKNIISKIKEHEIDYEMKQAVEYIEAVMDQA